MEKLDIKLLFVEDDTIIRNVYKQILKQFVKTLYVASDGKEGYDSYLINKPDLIVTDIKMPIMNGLDMINKIREQDKEMRIIIMSAYSESRFFINAIESGVKGFLIKPVETPNLKDVIQEQANDILMEKRLDEEAHKRHQAESERNKGEDLLRALLTTITSFFHDGINDKVLNAVLSLIGDKTNVSRAYIFKSSLRW
jgi:Response regulators consisting of a CheY-like rec eiver domain and a winged-helix DNA-binding domain